ncbi:hypothetical protein [Hydrocarboniphaga sp.]|uniref:hypothetical protein n=1 Tax=Hydrocarboniphaga sp. TaxID=2033016 RepID=UPI00262990A4|nr:hypothetical protein [Hydrocarboniphaga sp.]
MALLDVLIALLVLALGVAAMCQLQGLVLVEGGHARARAAAAQLARAKLDDLRQFSQLPAAGIGVFGLDEIGSDAGGRENADGSLVLPAGELSLSDVTYRRHWEVSAYSWCEGGVLTAGICSGARRAGFQQIRVTLSWTDADGKTSDLAIETAIAAIDPVLAGSALIRRPSLLPPSVVPN